MGFGIDAAVGQNVTLGVSYTGAFGSDIKSHGIGANIRIRF
ncbi:MAG: autotransporter outer membrane beta-barrel domain-containing protein [Duodenibacillus massiliensis]